MRSVSTSIHRGQEAAQRGLSLVELLVAMAIGAVLIFGATQVYVDSRKAYGTNEAVSRLQETARYAMSVIEPDVRVAGYWGFVKGASSLDVNTWATESAATASIAATSDANACGNNFSVEVDLPITGFNNRYVISSTQTSACNTSIRRTEAAATPTWTTTAVAAADTLIVRHAAITASDPTANTVQVCTNRINGYLFSNGASCGDYNSAGSVADGNLADASARTHAVNNMIVDAYYIDQNSEGPGSTVLTGVPSLRRKRLVAGPRYIDEQVIAGVEDMQVQFGIESDAATSPDGIAARYVNPEAVPTGAQIVSVRIWLMVRSDEPDIGFVDGRTYTYGDRTDTTGTSDLNSTAGAGKAFKPSASTSTAATAPQRYHRLLVSRTIQLRNAVGT